MIGILFGLVACGSADLRSEPTEATVVFHDPLPADQEIVWTDLEALFPPRPAALPAGLAELVPGMDGARARAVLAAARAPDSKIFTQVIEDTLATGAALADMPNVAATLLLAGKGATLDAIDVSLPDDVAVPMLTARWGPPTRVEPRDGGSPLYVWTGDPWSAALYSKPGEKAVVKFTRPGQAPPSTDAMPPESH